jgi:hypothetical protein
LKNTGGLQNTGVWQQTGGWQQTCGWQQTGGWQQTEEQLEGNGRGLIYILLFGVTLKNHKNIIQDRRCPDRDSNWARTKHKC